MVAMSKEERWFRTMEALHDVEVPPFNDNPEMQKKHDLHKTVMAKTRNIVDVLPLSEHEKDRLEDLIFVRTCATLKLYGYSIAEDGTVQHKTERGMTLIQSCGADQSKVPDDFLSRLEYFVR